MQRGPTVSDAGVRPVVAFNCAEHAALLEQLTRGLPVEIRHATYRLPWEEIAARRAGNIRAEQPAVGPELRAQLTDAEVIFGFAVPLNLRALAPRLQWIETPAVGFDQLNGTGVLDGGVAVTTVGGLFAPAVADHVFALLFAMWRRLDEFHAAQQRREWQLREVRELQDATMAIVGLGNIGRAVARAAQAFGMRVIGTRRGSGAVEGVERVFAREELPALLAEADVVVLAVAGTPETVNLIGANELACMKRDACLINVARGIVVDEAALAAALAAGRLGGAALDVFVREPLPDESPLWTLPNVIVTPHVAVNTPSKLRRSLGHFAENLTHYCAGEALRDRLP